MTAEQIRALGPAFAAYLRPFEPCFVDCSTAERRIRHPFADVGPRRDRPSAVGPNANERKAPRIRGLMRDPGLCVGNLP